LLDNLKIILFHFNFYKNGIRFRNQWNSSMESLSWIFIKVYGLSKNETILQPYTIVETVEWDNPDKIYFGQYVQNNYINP
jgi:hypothetical protein